MTSFPVKLPTFHGEPGQKHGEENWKAYKNAIDLAYIVSNTKVGELTDAHKVAHLLLGLTGKAKKFLELNPELRNKSYAEVDKAFAEKFGKANAKSLLDINSIVQKPGETVREYITRLKAAAEVLQEDSFNPTIASKDSIESLDPEDAKRLNIFTEEEYSKARNLVTDAFNKFLMPHFIRGLRPELKIVLLNGRPHTLEEAVQAAEEHEKYTEAYGGISTAGISMLQGDVREQGIIGEVAEQLQSLNMKSNEEQRHDKEEDNIRPTPYERETRTCYYCHKQGHLARDCRKRRSQFYRETTADSTSRYQPYPERKVRFEEDRGPGDFRRRWQEKNEPIETGESHMQRGMRYMRPQSTRSGREQYPGVSGKSRGNYRNVRYNNEGYPQEEVNQMSEESDEEESPPQGKGGFEGSDKPYRKRSPYRAPAEIHHKYGKRSARGRSKSQEVPKNGERRPLGRGLRFPAPRPYAKSTPKTWVPSQQ